MGFIPEIDVDPIMANLSIKLTKKSGVEALDYAIFDNKCSFGQAKRFVFDLYLNSSVNKTI